MRPVVSLRATVTLIRVKVCAPGSRRAAMDSYGIYAIVLLFLGLAILVTEVFVPSGGMLSVVTTVVLLLSAICAFAAWYQDYPARWWTYCALLVLLIPSTLGGAFYILPKTSVGKKVLLEAPDPADVEPFAEETARLQQLVGHRGQTLTLLNPGGIVLVDGERLHAFTEGLLLEPQTEIEIAEIRGTRVLVRPVDRTEPRAGVAEPPRPDRIDFEVPGE